MEVARPPMMNWFGVRSKRLPDDSDEVLEAAGAVGGGAAGGCVVACACKATGDMIASQEKRGIRTRRRMEGSELSHEELPGRMVGTMNVRVTIHAGSSKHPVALV